MKLFGLTITRTKALLATTSRAQTLSIVDSSRGWWPIIRESFAGAWQSNVEVRLENVLTYHCVYACVTLIASDIGKLRIKLVETDEDGIWTETDNAAFSPVLRKPNRYQNRIKFLEYWMVSKLLHGNTYVLKQRDERGVVIALYILDPTRVTPLVSEDGAVYYELKRDTLSGLTFDAVVIPASEIIHDVMVPLYHPLVGVSPITACGIAAVQGLRIQENSTLLFANGAMPGGVLTAPGIIKQETAERLKLEWETRFSGANAGKVAVLGDGLKYEQMAVNATDAQLIEQLKWSCEAVCSVFHVPPYMIGCGDWPAVGGVEPANQQYYSQALQNPIECIELLLDEGLGLAKNGSPQTLGTELDLDGLLRMDTATRVKTAREALQAAMSPNEARLRYHDLPRVKGGDSPMMQQQNFSLEALAERDADKPFAKPKPAPAAEQAPPAPGNEGAPDGARVSEDEAERVLGELLRKELRLAA